MSILTLALAVGLILVTVALVRSRRDLAQVRSAPVAEPQPVLAEPVVAEGPPTRAEPGGPVFPGGPATEPLAASEGWLRVGRPGVDYTAAFVADRRTGRVLYGHNAHEPVPTASMAKMMTCLIVMEEIEAGRLALDEPVTISARASRMGGSQIYAREGQVFTVETLLAATMVQSANDAATALAEKVGGSVESFAELMNRRGRDMGLEGSTFYDPHGLPSRDGRENVMTARDLAVVGQELMRYPLMREYAATATLPFENATFTSGMTNPNRLLRSYDGAYGIKTGYTASAGFSITASARRGDMDVIAVVTGAKSARGPMSSFGLAGELMNEAFLSWSTVVAVREGSPVGDVPVKGGAARIVGAVAARDAIALVPRGGEERVNWRLQPREVEAPLAAGDTVGTVLVLEGELEVARVPALAAEVVERRPWWRLRGARDLESPPVGPGVALGNPTVSRKEGAAVLRRSIASP